MKQLSKPKHHGFTLAELLVVITIIVILAGIVIGSMQYAKTKQKNSQAKIQINLLESAIERYHADNGDYPGDENAGGPSGENQTNTLFRALYYDGFQANDKELIYLSDLDPDNDVQKWLNGTGSSVTIVDPWGEEYLYRRGSGANNPDFDLWSTGPDGPEGSQGNDKDDISNF
jgi:general secretion pathway protein G